MNYFELNATDLLIEYASKKQNLILFFMK